MVVLNNKYENIFLPGSERMDHLIRKARVKKSLYEFTKEFWGIVEPGVRYVDSWHVKAICDHLQAISEGVFRNLIIAIPPGHMKPMNINTLVLMSDGSYRRLADIRVGDCVISHEGMSRRVTAVHHQGLLPTLRITTHSGREIVPALDHPLLTPRGWVQAKDVKIGEPLAIVKPRDGQINGGCDWENERCRLLGYFIGDGCVVGNKNKDANRYNFNASIACHDEIESRDIIACCEAIGYRASNATGTSKNKKLNISGTGLREWLFSIGLSHKDSYSKRIPKEIFNCSNEQIEHILAAYFACDGTLNSKGLSRSDLCISFTSVNRELLEDVQRLFSRIGINFRIRRRSRKIEGIKNQRQGGSEEYVYYNLEISTFSDSRIFIDRIADKVFHSKRERLLEWSPILDRFPSHISPDPIVSIEDNGECECMCLTVEEDHSFTANDLAVHNSLTTSVMWPAWEWANFPHKRSLYGSYDESLVFRDSVKARDIIKSDHYQNLIEPEWEIKKDTDSKGFYANTMQGARKAFFVGSKFKTGWRGDGRVIDDPLSAEEAYNKEAKLKVINTWDRVMASRVNDPRSAYAVIMMQRLADDDLIGHTLRTYPGKYVYLMLPTEYDPDRHCVTPIFEDPRKTAGELLFPTLYPQEVIDDLKVSLGDPDFQAQYNHKPYPDSGLVFNKEHFQYYKLNGDLIYLHRRDGAVDVFRLELCEMFVSVDVATSEKQTADFTVYGMWAITPKRDLVLLDVIKARMSEPESVRTAIKINEFRRRGSIPYSFFAVESNSVGLPLVQNLREKGIPVNEIFVHKDKMAMSVTARVRLASGQIFFPSPDQAPWLYDFEEELLKFPGGEHDDQVSMISIAANAVFDMRGTIKGHKTANISPTPVMRRGADLTRHRLLGIK